MPRKNLDTLQHEINTAVHPTGGLPKVTGPALNFVLNSLATEVAAAGAPLQIVDYNAAINDLENKFFETGEAGTCAFAVGDLVTQAGQGLYQCVQAFTVGFDREQEDSVNSHYPSGSPAYWRVVQQPGDALFVKRNELNYQMARFGTGPNSSIVASPNLPHASTGDCASIVGGLANTSAATLGTVVGGYRLTLPAGADYSVVLGGSDFTAPARPNTVFAPRLVLWENGATVELTDVNGNPHPLGVSTDGMLLLDGLPLTPNYVAMPFVPLTGSDGSPYTLAVNGDGTLTLNGLAAAAAPTPFLKLIDQSGTPHTLTVAQAGALLLDGQPVGAAPPYVSSLGLIDANNNVHTLTANEDGALLIDGQGWVRSLTLLDPNYTTHTLTVGAAGTLLLDGAPLVPPPAPAPPAPTPLMSFTAQTNYFVAADPETRRVPLEVPYLYEQPANLPDPELRNGGLVVPRRGYYEIVTHVVIEPNQLAPTDSCGICGGPDFDWMYQGWTDGSPAPRNLTAYMSRHMLLEAGDVVYLFAQFTGTSAKVLGRLTLYLLHNA